MSYSEPAPPNSRPTNKYSAGPRFIVAANGLFPQTQPNVPSVPGRDKFRGKVLHTVDYHSGARFKGKSVLLVGFGNSANDVICDLWYSDTHTILPHALMLCTLQLDCDSCHHCHTYS